MGVLVVGHMVFLNPKIQNDKGNLQNSAIQRCKVRRSSIQESQMQKIHLPGHELKSFEVSGGPFRGPWGYLWAPGRGQGGLLAGHWGSPGIPGRSLEGSRGVLERSRASLGDPWGVSGGSWGIPGGVSGGSWGSIGAPRMSSGGPGGGRWVPGSVFERPRRLLESLKNHWFL